MSMPLGQSRSSSAPTSGGPVVDAASKPSSSVSHAALVVGAGDADHRQPLMLGDLPGDAAGRAGCAADHDHLARLRLAEVEQPEVRRHAGAAEHAEDQRGVEVAVDTRNGTRRPSETT
jgi:hypothetical protein